MVIYASKYRRFLKDFELNILDGTLRPDIRVATCGSLMISIFWETAKKNSNERPEKTAAGYTVWKLDQTKANSSSTALSHGHLGPTNII